MSRTIELAAEAVKSSTFTFLDNKTLEARDVFLFWTNFRGEPNKFGNSARTFNMAINEDLAKKLDEEGWRVRSVFVDEEQQIPLYFINVKINIESAYPPIVTMFSEYKGKKSRTALSSDTIGELDRADIKTADCVINAYRSKNFPDKVTGYLKKLNIIVEPVVDFGGKYDDWMDSPEEAQFIDGNPNPFMDSEEV